jgi:type II secretory pathway pseudopilin PulG
MLLKCKKGYILIEMLVSLNILLILCLFLLPNYLLVKNERINLKMTNEANSLLHEELKLVILEEKERQGKVVNINGLTYQMNWNDELDKLCISWNNRLQRNSTRCSYAAFE